MRFSYSGVLETRFPFGIKRFEFRKKFGFGNIAFGLSNSVLLGRVSFSEKVLHFRSSVSVSEKDVRFSEESTRPLEVIGYFQKPYKCEMVVTCS